ncbi:uncharacterized protein [Battus philenor]|uniref:uncharacterized protein n=1 Tax=Battus philenor TaxID=42288 RepID=UPI0035D0C8D0
MPQLWFSFLTVLFVLPSSRCSDLGKDGFNFYKDYLRGRSEDILPEQQLPEKMIYFYRTPVQLFSSHIPSNEQEYREWAGNAFKNYMLKKDLRAIETPEKRVSKTVLSLMLQSKQPYQVANNNSNEEMDNVSL